MYFYNKELNRLAGKYLNDINRALYQESGSTDEDIIKAQIDYALDNRDKKKFMELSKLLKGMKR